ncbi:MAG: hypothetical protein AMJ84_00735 [Acidithiobacillales bacterium SM23_46]|nr:MAG: hypothetical protein AMS22_00380 [Thiotrichales bacterium SG8_50]KPK74086.1 MAG: hypothetical protein AMJ84_00735 [Acidithiobacillales bacterium SM23_46]
MPACATTTMETRGFFPNRRGQQLYFCAHGRAENGVGWIFCNPFLEEKTFTHSVYVALARQLAAEGQFVLRFDYAGDGDSEGDLASIGLDEWVDDVSDAAALGRDSFGLTRPRMFGLRLGAAVALRSVRAVGAVQALLWEPVVRGANYFQDCLMLNVTTQLAVYKRVMDDRRALRERLDRGETVNIAGHEIGKLMAESIEAFVLADTIGTVGCPVDIVAVLKTDGATPNRDLQALVGRPGISIEGRRAVPFWLEPRVIEAPPATLWEASRQALRRHVADIPGDRS